MGSSRLVQTGLMDLRSSTSAPFLAETLSFTTFMSLAKQVTNCFRELQATSDRICDLGTFWYHSHLSTQYCDGLRGPIVVYDPEDPHADLYDIDNGKFVSSQFAYNATNMSFRRHCDYFG